MSLVDSFSDSLVDDLRTLVLNSFLGPSSRVSLALTCRYFRDLIRQSWNKIKIKDFSSSFGEEGSIKLAIWYKEKLKWNILLEQIPLGAIRSRRFSLLSSFLVTPHFQENKFWTSGNFIVSVPI